MAVWGPGASPRTAAPLIDAEPADRSAKPPHRWWDIVVLPVFASVLLVALAVGGIALALQFGFGPPGDPLADMARFAAWAVADPVILNVGNMLGYALLVFMLMLLLAWRGFTLQRAHFSVFGVGAVVVAVLCGALLALFIMQVIEFLPRETLNEIEALESQIMPDTVAGIVAFAILAVVFAPFAEELYFRGVVLPVLARRLRFAAAAVISSAFFSVIHGHLFLLGGIGGWALAGAIFTVGLALACAARWSGALYAPVAMHAAYNATLFAPAVMMLVAGDQT